MNRLILRKRHVDYSTICEHNQPYDYKLNPGYSCIEIDDEYLCIIKLKYRIKQHIDDDGKHLIPEYADMPTYAIVLDIV